MSAPREMTEARKLQLSRAMSVYELYERTMARAADWGRTDRYPTAWAQFDKYLYGGFGRKTGGDLVVIAGETKIGKSTFAANIAMRIAQSGEQVEYIPLENDYEDTCTMLAKAGGEKNLLNYKDLLYLPDEELINGDEAWNAEDLILHMEHMVEAWHIKVFVLDHLNYMFENEEQVKDELHRVRVIMRKLRQFCKRHQAVVLAISHMNKGESKTQAKVDKPNLNRIYGSQAIAGTSTKVILVTQGESCIGRDGKQRRMVEVKLERSSYTPNQSDWFAFDATDTQWLEEGVKLI